MSNYIGTIPYTVNFVASDPTNTVKNWYWNLTGGNNPDYYTQSVTYTYTSSGTYTVSLTGVNPRYSSTTSTSVTALAPTPPFIFIGYSALSGNIQFPISLTGLDFGTPTITNWYWNLTGGNNPDYFTKIVNYTVTQSGTYKVSLTGIGGSRKNTATITISAYTLENTFSYWYSVDLPVNMTWNDIAYDERTKSVVLIGNDLTSARLNASNNRYGTAESVQLAAAGSNNSFQTLACNNSGVFIVFRQNAFSGIRFIASRSIDGGLTYSDLTVPAGSYGNTVATFYQDKFIIGDLDSTSLNYSSNSGTSWTSVNTPRRLSDSIQDNFAFNQSTIILSVLVGDGYNPVNYLLYSTNITSPWTQRTLPKISTWGSAAFGNSIFLVHEAGGNQGAYSTNNAISWALYTLPSDNTSYKVCFANNKFIAIRSDIPSLTGLYSYNAIDWYTFTLPYAVRPKKMIFKDDRLFIAQQSSNKCIIGTNFFETVTAAPIPPSPQYGSIYLANFLDYTIGLTVGGFSVREIGTRNPTLTCIRGQNYDLNLSNLLGQNFSIRNSSLDTSSIAGNFQQALFNNNPLSGKSNTKIMFTPDQYFANQLTYQCTTIPSISGFINII